jgi:hypothetical protein
MFGGKKEKEPVNFYHESVYAPDAIIYAFPGKWHGSFRDPSRPAVLYIAAPSHEEAKALSRKLAHDRYITLDWVASFHEEVRHKVPVSK